MGGGVVVNRYLHRVVVTSTSGRIERRVYEGWYSTSSDAVFGVLRTMETDDGVPWEMTIDVTRLTDKRHRATPGLRRTL